MSTINQHAKNQLDSEGYCILRNAIPTTLIDQLIEHAQALEILQTNQEKEELRSLGSLISLWKDPFFCSLITHPNLLAQMQSLGAGDLRFSNGYLLAKPPHSMPTFWHQDWWLWSDKESYTSFVHQIGVLCYLQDVDEHNGALRVIPGSHRKQHSLHSLLRQLDIKDLRRGENPNSPLFKNQTEEIILSLKQGDLVIMDARLLHSACSNKSNKCRYGLTLWYYPNYQLFKESVKAQIGTTILPLSWQVLKNELQPLLTEYNGDATPLPQLYHPDWLINQ